MDNYKIVFTLIKSERNGLTPDSLVQKLNEYYFGKVFFENFYEFINFNVLSGRLEKKESKLFVTERGERYLEYISS